MKHQKSALTRSTHVVSPETRRRDLLGDTAVGQTYPIMWIDGVGGFLLIESEEMLIGQAVPNSSVAIPIVGDLSRQAAAIRRTGGDYLLQALQPMHLNAIPVERPQLLNSGDLLQFGNRVKLKFHKPSPLSSTARLTMESLNRFKPTVDGVLMLADSCIIGPNPSSHVHCPDWTTEILLFRKGAQWVFRVMEEVDVNGSPAEGHIPLQPGLRIRGEEFSLSIE